MSRTTASSNSKENMKVIGYQRQEAKVFGIEIPLCLMFLVNLYYDDLQSVAIFNPNLFSIEWNNGYEQIKHMPHPGRSYNYGIIYISSWISSTCANVLKWTFKIQQIEAEMSLAFVTIDNHSVHSKYGIPLFDRKADYPILSSWNIRKNKDIGKRYPKALDTPAYEGDIVEIILDLSNARIGYTLQKQGLLRTCNMYTDICVKKGLQYKLAIQLPSIGDCVIMKAYQCI